MGKEPVLRRRPAGRLRHQRRVRLHGRRADRLRLAARRGGERRAGGSRSSTSASGSRRRSPRSRCSTRPASGCAADGRGALAPPRRHRPRRLRQGRHAHRLRTRCGAAGRWSSVGGSRRRRGGRSRATCSRRSASTRRPGASSRARPSRSRRWREIRRIGRRRHPALVPERRGGAAGGRDGLVRPGPGRDRRPADRPAALFGALRAAGPADRRRDDRRPRPDRRDAPRARASATTSRRSPAATTASGVKPDPAMLLAICADAARPAGPDRRRRRHAGRPRDGPRGRRRRTIGGPDAASARAPTSRRSPTLVLGSVAAARRVGRLSHVPRSRPSARMTHGWYDWAIAPSRRGSVAVRGSPRPR